MEPKDALVADLPHVERIAAALARRHGLAPDEAADFTSTAKLRLVENDYAVLRKFRGESSLATYLTVVIAMFFREWRVARHGRWRPSAAAERRGRLAVRLETLVHRDGYRLEQAGELLRTRGETVESDRQLAALLAELPPRAPIRPVPVAGEVLDTLPSGAAADERVAEAEAEQDRRATAHALQAALEGLPAEDRLILRMRFWEEMSVADIARGLALPQKPLYRRMERALAQLRGTLEAAGLTRGWVRMLLEEPSRGLDPETNGNGVHPIRGGTNTQRGWSG